MENCDNVVGVGSVVAAGAGVVGAVAKPFAGLAASIRNKAKAKKAQKISDAGGYMTLTAFQKSLIPIPSYITTAQIPAEVAQTAEPVEITAGQAGTTLKKFLPWILGAIVLGLVAYFIIKKR